MLLLMMGLGSENKALWGSACILYLLTLVSALLLGYIGWGQLIGWPSQPLQR